MPREIVNGHNGHVGLISSLPKWAQDEIHRLDDVNQDLRRALTEDAR